jgi:large subunit ribosomal protein L24e
MVERRVCTFCGDEIEPGTGRMYIKKDGVIFNFCSSKCFKNMVVLGRVPRRTTWTRYYEREKQVRMKGLPPPEEKPAKARKLKKVEKKAAEEPESKKPEPAEEKEEQKPKPSEKKEQAKKDSSPKPEKRPSEAKKSAPKRQEPAKKEPGRKAEEAEKE